jgi:predicted ester cyclase
MSAEENKALVRRFLEARGKTDLDALDKMLATNFVSHTKLLPGYKPDREGYKRTIAEYAATFSNRRFLVEQQVAEADKVVSRVTAHATHDRKAFLGVAPTGKEATYKTIFIHRISGGKIAEELKARGMPLGLMSGMNYEEGEASLREGEHLLLQRRVGRGPRPRG